MAATAEERRDRYATDPEFREKAKASRRAQYAGDPTLNRERAKEWKASLTPEQRRENRRKEHAKIRQDVLGAYGAQCACCETTYEPHLTLDHVDGGGTRERRERKGANLWRVARQEGFPDRFQILCFNCNWAKHRDGECRCQGPNLQLVAGGAG